MTENIARKKDFIELEFSGYANGVLFDSNMEKDLKSLDAKAKPKKTIVVVGEGMVVSGLDKELEGKEVGKEYEVTLSPKESFGERRKEFVKTIPLKAFTQNKVYPKAGMILTLDNAIAKIITISGARVITDFNNPLAGKEIKYNFKIVRKVSDEKEKIESALELVFRFVPKFEIKEDKVVIEGPKGIKSFIDSVSQKFKDLIGKGLGFKEIEVKEKKASEQKSVQ